MINLCPTKTDNTTSVDHINVGQCRAPADNSTLTLLIVAQINTIYMYMQYYV
jgi:hypothetical protein